MNVIVKQRCRLCGAESLTPILNLDKQMLATAFSSNQKEDCFPLRKVPLELVRCNPEINQDACGLVQLKHTFPSVLTYSEYWYLSGVNQTMRDALKEISDSVTSMVDLKAGETVVDIGCNDGTLLNSYSVEGLDKIGFDPAQNLTGIKGESFHRVADFFNSAAYDKIRPSQKAKIITSIAMFYDIDDPNGFVSDIGKILAEDGVWVLQMADLPNMLRFNMFDNICHEHLCYYHMAPLEILFKNHGLRIIDIEKNYVNGSSYRIYIGKIGGLTPTESGHERVMKVRFEEFNMGLDTDEPYKKFEENIVKNKHDLLFFLKQKKDEGKKVFVYGASTKGNVLLQYCGIDTDLIEFAVERNPKKFGKKTIGTNIPIISEEEAREMSPDYFLVLPYHFIEEILIREESFVNAGGKFVIPVPKVRTLPE